MCSGLLLKVQLSDLDRSEHKRPERTQNAQERLRFGKTRVNRTRGREGGAMWFIRAKPGVKWDYFKVTVNQELRLEPLKKILNNETRMDRD